MSRKMKFEGNVEEGRSQRDLFTVVKCMLCIIPESAITLREELEELSLKLSYPDSEDLVDLDKELALIFYDYYEDYKKYMWMKIVIALFFNKNINDILKVYDDDIDDVYAMTDINAVKDLCDRGIFETIVEYIEKEDTVYVRLKDTYKKKVVDLTKIENAS